MRTTDSSPPLRVEDLKVVQGNSGRGLQFVCACGCVNWNHLQMSESIWSCRNCGRVLTYNFPALAEGFRASEKPPAGQPAPAPAP